MIVSKRQNLFFGDNVTSITNTGDNLITNGSFNASISGWTATNFSWSSGTAAYSRVSGCYGGSITQALSLVANKKYKLTFKYKATSDFDIIVGIADASSPQTIIYPETTTHAITNGLWQLVEVYFISPTDINVILSLETISIGGESEDACGATGTEETGLWFDDVTVYATKRINRNCEDCDIIVMDSNKNVEFQVQVDTSDNENLITNSEFDTNPFDLIVQSQSGGSGGNGFAFYITSLPALNKEFVIYMCGKAIRVKRINTGIDGYAYTATGIYYDVTIRTTAGGGVGTLDSYNDILLSFFNNIIDPLCGTLTLYLPDPDFQFSIFFAEDPIYISNTNDLISSILDVTPTDIVASNFVYSGSDMCYRKWNDGDNFYQFSPVNLIAGETYRFTISYSSLYSDFTVLLLIDDGTNPPYAAAFAINATSAGTATATFTALLTASTTIQLVLREPCETVEFIETPCHNKGFCFDVVELIRYNTSDFFTEIKYIDCHGVEHALEYSTIVYGDNVLIQLPTISGRIQIIVVDMEGNEYRSVWIDMMDFNTMDDCVRNAYLKLNWFDDCMLDNVDYGNLPFMNEVYLYGSIKEINNVLKERIVFYGESGKVEPVFSHTLDAQTLTIANYSNTLQRSIAKIFEHKYIYVNDERVKIDSGKYEIIPIPSRDGNSTGEIECIIDGSELINSSCCC